MSFKSRLRSAAGNLYKTVTFHGWYPFLYRQYARRPIQKKKIVFLEIRMPELTDSFWELYRALEQQGEYELKTCFLQEGMVSRLQVIKNSRKVLQEIADAGWVFINDSSYLISCLPLRNETKVLQTWHACGAFKKFGYSTADKKFGAAVKELERFPLHRNFSYVTVSSPEVVWAYAEAFHMEKEQEKILPLGVSRTDCFYQPERQESARQRVRAVLQQHGLWEADTLSEPAKQRKIVLYAPTFRGKVADAYAPDVLEFETLQKAVGTEYLLLCKHHPFVKKRPLIPENCRGFALDVTELLEIEDLLMVSDVCMTDYSSLVFEYSLMQRPIAFLAYDLEAYYDWRGFYYPYEEMTPGPILKDTQDVIAYLRELEKNFEEEKIRAFREKFMGACDGHATERILKLIKKMENSV